MYLSLSIKRRSDPENTLKQDYPNVGNHLTDHREQLEGRTYVLESGKEWYEIWCERRPIIYSTPKLLTPDIADRNQFSIDTDDQPKYFNTKVKNIKLSGEQGAEEYYGLLGVLNSKLIEFIYRGIAPPKQGGFRSYKPGFLSQLKVPNSGLEDIAEKAETIRNAKRKISSLNLSLVDYLGNFEEGPSLPDIGLYQPTNPSILDATSEDFDKLQIENARTERDGRRVTIHATARYKPENEDEYETDQWGYTETDYKEAFALTDLSEEEAALVEAFVPVAVEEADGFAGFRDNATKTNSLIDRLKAITLPDPDDVADDLRRYLEVKERAEELDEKIEKTDRLIDEIVYDLYDLTEEEIEIVEESVADD